MGKGQRTKKVFLQLGVPDIGGHLGTQNIDGHASFKDNLFYTLNNHPGFNQIHIHRSGNGTVLFVCKKTTTDGTAPGVGVSHTSALYAEAVRRAAEQPPRFG